LWLLTLHLGLALVKRNISFDLVHAGQRIGIVPRRILDFSLVGRHGIVRRVALVRTMRLGRGGTEVRLGNGVGWELLSMDWSGRTKDEGMRLATHVNVTVDDFPFVRLGDYDAVYRCGCVGHDRVWVMYWFSFMEFGRRCKRRRVSQLYATWLLHHRPSVRSAEYVLTNKSSASVDGGRHLAVRSWLVESVGMLRLCCRRRVAEL
jgi:hypothetical protein